LLFQIQLVPLRTGDNKATAEAVASQVGLGEEEFLGSHPASLLARKNLSSEALDANGVPVSGSTFPPGKSFQGGAVQVESS
jgi:magnesium-transporting ATPase (P-type)